MSNKNMVPPFTGHLGEVYVRCDRGDWHKLSKCEGAPTYQCEGELRFLKVGDIVEVRGLEADND